MLSRREFLIRNLKGASLLAVGSVVPEFLANTARAAEAGKDTILVVIEMSGGNDGLNTVIPFADKEYRKARPTLAIPENQVLKLNDEVGLHPAMANLQQMIQQKQVAAVQGVGYPNPDRSHFESMDIWQSADPRRKTPTGWIARSAAGLQDKQGNVPVMQIGPNRLPLALQGAPSSVVSINNNMPYRLDLGGGTPDQQKARKQLIKDLAGAPGKGDEAGDLLQFVQRRQLQTYTTLEKLQDVLRNAEQEFRNFGDQAMLTSKLQLVARLIDRGFGARVFYVMIDGFDTHSGQAQEHQRLLGEIGNAVSFFFQTLQPQGHDKRTVVMTFSEFGRRVYENGSRGTDHGSGSCLFVMGPGVKGGAVGKHPSLTDLDQGDLKHHTDFRQVYATLLDQWLGVDSRHVLGDKYEHLDLIKAKG